MLHLTKREIYQAFADWYGLGGDSCDAMMQSGRLNHFNTGGWVLSEAARESADKAQLIWEVAQCAPELWTVDGKIDVALLVGHDPMFFEMLFPDLRDQIDHVYRHHKTAAMMVHKNIAVAPIGWYLNACASVLVQFDTMPFGAFSLDTAMSAYNRVSNVLSAAVRCASRNRSRIESQEHTASMFATMVNILRSMGVLYTDATTSNEEFQKNVDRDGYTVFWLNWVFTRCNMMAKDAEIHLKGVKVLEGGEHLSGFFNKIPMPKRPIIGANGIVQGFEPFFDNTAQSKHDPRAPVGYDAADTMILSGTKAEYTFLSGRTEGDPLDNPVAAWLAETLRPRTINWVSDDPITDILEAAAEATAWKDAVGVTLAKQAAILMHNLHQLNKGSIRHDMPDWGDFQTRIAKLADSGDVDGLFRYIYDVCGERVKLKVLTAAPALCHMTHRIGDGRYSILWESTGTHVISGLGDNKYDILSADNIRHLRACYNAHIHKADRKPCSHSTSRKN